MSLFIIRKNDETVIINTTPHHLFLKWVEAHFKATMNDAGKRERVKDRLVQMNAAQQRACELSDAEAAEVISTGRNRPDVIVVELEDIDLTADLPTPPSLN